MLKPTLLLNAKCGSILGRSTDAKRATDATDIKFLLNWCASNQMYPTAEEVSQATTEFVEYFVSIHGEPEIWTNAGWDFKNGMFSTSCLVPLAAHVKTIC